MRQYRKSLRARALPAAAVVAFALVAAFWLPVPACAQMQEIPTGRAFVLVATRDMPDNLFAHTVILIFAPKETHVLVVGLIVNRPTKIPVKTLFPEAAAMSKERESAYFGGPVDPTDPSILVESAAPPSGSVPAFGDIYAIFDHAAVAKLLKSPSQVKELRVILGRSQWSLDQLHHEVAEGSWYVQPAQESMMFPADGLGLWRKLVNRGQLIETSIERRTIPIALWLPPPPWSSAACASQRCSGNSVYSGKFP